MDIKKTLIALTIAFVLPTQIIADKECINSLKFRYFFDGKYRTCKNIRINKTRRETLCPLEKVNAYCPQTCGQCCEDIEGYTFTRKNGLVGDCAWLREKPVRKARYCHDTKLSYNDRTVRDGCPKTCDFCFSLIEVATTSPSGAPTASPSASASKTPSPIPTIEPTKSPTPEPTKAPFPLPSSQPSFPLSDVPSMRPSSSSSDMPSVQPSDLPTARPSSPPSDVPSDIPNMQPSDIPSMLPSVSPTSKPSNTPTMSNKPSFLPSMAPVIATGSPTVSPTTPAPTPACVNSRIFTWNLETEGTEVGCAWITMHKRVSIRRENYCRDGGAIVAACPQACGVCVADDPAFTFKLKNMNELRDCAWIMKNAKKVDERLEYCKRASVAAGCAATCE